LAAACKEAASFKVSPERRELFGAFLFVRAKPRAQPFAPDRRLLQAALVEQRWTRNSDDVPANVGGIGSS
jgi:hypothetical protein